MAQKVTLAGNIIVDNVKTITAWPEKGMLVLITSVKRSPGGAVPNSGIDLKTLDPSVEVAAFGKVGDDAFGKLLLNTIKEAGIDISGMTVMYTEKDHNPSAQRSPQDHTQRRHDHLRRSDTAGRAVR